MITGRKAIKPIGKEDILSRINPKDIYEFYTGERIEYNRCFKSPFHKDDSPSFMVSDRDGKVHHFDYADDDKKGNCIDFVMQIRNISFREAIELIAYDMSVQCMPQVYNIEDSSDEERVKVRKSTSIIVKTRKWYKEAIEYWNEYGISVEKAKQERIYCVSELYLNRSRFSIPQNELVFGYLIDDKWWKIYQPYAKDKKNKWMYNGPNDYIEGLNTVEPGGKLIVTKSRKDRICLASIYPKVVNVQNESIAAYNKKNIAYLKDNFDEIYINYDCDASGVKASWKVTKELTFKHLNVPYIYLGKGIKDLASMYKEEGREAVENYLLSKGFDVRE